MYVSHYNLKQNKDDNSQACAEWVAGKKRFPWCGNSGRLLRSSVVWEGLKGQLTQKWEERNFKQREDGEQCNWSADLKRVCQARFSCARQEPAGSTSLQMVVFEDTGLQGPHTETGQSYRSKQGTLRPPDTSNVREPLSPEEVAWRTLRRVGALGEGSPTGAEVGRLVTTVREEAAKQRGTGRNTLTSFLCSAYANASVAKLSKTSTSKGPWMTGHRHQPPGRRGTNRAEKDQEWKLGEQVVERAKNQCEMKD